MFRPKLEIQALFHPKNVMKYGVSPQNTPIWASICTPVAPSLLIYLGHSPRLGGVQFSFGEHKQSFGGARHRYAPPWRRVWIEFPTFVTAGDDCIQHSGTRCSPLRISNFQRFTAEGRRTTGQHFKCREIKNFRRNNEQPPT